MPYGNSGGQSFQLRKQVACRNGFLRGRFFFRYRADGFVVVGPLEQETQLVIPAYRRYTQVVFFDSVIPSGRGQWEFIPALEDTYPTQHLLYVLLPAVPTPDSVRWYVWHAGNIMRRRVIAHVSTRSELPMLWPLPTEMLWQKCDSITLSVGPYRIWSACTPIESRLLSGMALLDSQSIQDLYMWAEYRAEIEERPYRIRADDADDSLFQLSRYFVRWHGTGAYDRFREALADIQYVNQTFGSAHQRGIYSDRGRVFIQYGPPNDTWGHELDPGALPYQIWKYNVTPHRRNVIFVFYNPTGIDNEYELIHSTAYGELRNPRWRTLIYQRFAQPDNIHSPGRRDYFGGSLEYFR